MKIFKNRRGYYNPKKSLTPLNTFCTVSIISMAVLLVCFIISKGELIAQYFFRDVRDTGMDFFHSIEYVRGRTPYEVFRTLYPPLANLFFYCIYWLVSRAVSEDWIYDYRQSINMRGTNSDLRTHQSTMILFILFVLVIAFMFIAMVTTVLKKYSGGKANLVAFCLLFSYGMLWGMERGNILILTVPMVMFFLYFYDSKNPILRELAIITLAIAAGLKIYPAFFGVILLKDKKFVQAVRAVVYGIASVVLPCLVFREGLEGLKIWLGIMFNFGSRNKTPYIGTGFANLLHRIVMYADRYLGIDLSADWFAYAGYAVAFILIICTLFCKKRWQTVLALTMSIIMFQSQEQYIYCLLCIPMVMFLAEEKTFDKYNITPFILMSLMIVHLPIFKIATRNPRFVLLQVISVLTMLWCVVTAVITVYKQYKLKRGNEDVQLAE